MGQLEEIFVRHSRYQDAVTAALEHHLRDIVNRATAGTIAELQRKLSITNGVIDGSAANAKLLRKIGETFMAEMRKFGYDRLVGAYVSEFRGQFPFLQDTIAYLGEQVNQKWAPIKWTQADLKLLSVSGSNAVASINAAVESVATTAMARSLFGVGALPFRSLVETLSDKLGQSIGRATGTAETAMNVFYRTAQDRQFQKIEADLPQQEQRYEYSGVRDKLNRPFCRRLLDVNKDYTRAEIDEMSNGSGLSVWTCCGGWRCRHQWLLSVRRLLESKAA